MTSHHIVNQLGNDNCLADAGPAEQTGFAPLFQRRQHINGLDTGLKNFRSRGPLVDRYRFGMNGSPLGIQNLPLPVNGLPKNIEDPS